MQRIYCLRMFASVTVALMMVFPPAWADDAKEDEILANQKLILANQEKILENQKKLDSILMNQGKLDVVLEKLDQCKDDDR